MSVIVVKPAPKLTSSNVVFLTKVITRYVFSLEGTMILLIANADSSARLVLSPQVGRHYTTVLVHSPWRCLSARRLASETWAKAC